MDKYTTKMLIENLAAEKELTKAQAKEYVEYIFAQITENMVKKDQVDINGFGKFSVRIREAHMACNPATGEQVEVAASKKIKFVPSKVLKDLVQ